LPAEQVRASQRERLLRGMLECVAQQGYEATTVPQVVAAARVSRNAFYEFFSDKADCFLAACDQEADELLASLLAQDEASSWIEAVRTGTRLYLRWWQDRPALSRAYFIGLPSAGERAMRQRERQYARFREMFEALAARARAEQPELEPLPPFIPPALVAAITELVAGEVRAGHVQHLTDLEDAVAFLTLKLLADEPTARRATAGS
jgi:AcrR family transcriptional regulator